MGLIKQGMKKSDDFGAIDVGFVTRVLKNALNQGAESAQKNSPPVGWKWNNSE